MSKGKGLLALVGLAAGAFAFWKYKNMTPEEKQQLKSKVSETGRKLKDKASDLESTVTDKYDQIKNKAKQEFKDVAQ